MLAFQTISWPICVALAIAVLRSSKARSALPLMISTCARSMTSFGLDA
jgi:hypothetical protein